MDRQILLNWIGVTDLKKFNLNREKQSFKKFDRADWGPALRVAKQLMKEGVTDYYPIWSESTFKFPFKKNNPEHIPEGNPCNYRSEYFKWVKEALQDIEVHTESWQSTKLGPAKPIGLHKHAKKAYKNIVGNFDDNISLFHANISPGTPAMQLALILLKLTDNRDIRLYQCDRDGNITTFEVEGLDIPSLLEAAGKAERRHLAGIGSKPVDTDDLGIEYESFGDWLYSPNSSVSREVAAHAERSSSIPHINILLTGETGTGKELLARGIHRRRVHLKLIREDTDDTKFISQNLSAIPDTLVEGELFGVAEGAATDVRKDITGAFAAAHEGTLFLDEIAEMSLQLQKKLLRALQYDSHNDCFWYKRIGDPRQKSSKFNLICATNVGLPNKDKLREDLFYRIDENRISIPPLRERRDDIEVLARYFMYEYDQIQTLPQRRFTLTEDAIDLLKNDHNWPGNARELRSVICKIRIASWSNDKIETETVKKVLGQYA